MAAHDPLEVQPSTPTPTPTASPKSDVDPIFGKQLKGLQIQAAAAATATVKGQQVRWMMPELDGKAGQLNGWSGDLFDWKGMAKPFDRSKSNQAYNDAIKEPKSPGTTGDLIITTAQIDYLAAYERAFRFRHCFRRPRLAAHSAGRQRGHGRDTGSIAMGVMEYINALVKTNKV